MHPTARRVVTASIALVATLALAGPACSSSKSSSANDPTTTTTEAPEDHLATDAEVSSGLADVQALNAKAVTQLATDQATAKKTVDQSYDAWYLIEGTIKKNSTSAYLDLEDGLGALKNGVDQNDATKAAGGATAFATAAASYLSEFGAGASTGSTTATP